ncbi:MAG: hypothetical protein L0Y57_04805 [Beijerinckiaceae bacterium]|nr:hypothetical protein [Beijerinckiaceae bacterium]
MSYLILALGALLSVGGALALHASYGIVQIERGWAGVIAGSTALSCGVVTIALGLILHRLSSFYSLVKGASGAAPLPRGRDAHEAGGGPHAEQTPPVSPGAIFSSEAGPLPPVMPPASGIRTWPQRQARSNLSPGRVILKPRGQAGPAAARTREPDSASPQAPITLPDDLRSDEAAFELPTDQAARVMPAEANDETRHELEFRPSSRAGEEAFAVTERKFGGEPSLSDDDMRREHAIEAAVPELPIAPGEHGLGAGPNQGWPAETASIEAILTEDIRFAPDATPEARKEEREESREALNTESFSPELPVSSETEAVCDREEPSSGDVLPTRSVVQSDTLAIVGRYESDGTSYVMYADGSIEARTEHAVFHFKSMSELKSFMDSQAQNSRS